MHAYMGKNTIARYCMYVCMCTLCSRFSSIMVPLQSSLNVTLPGDGNSGPHNPFPGAQPTIEKFEDRVSVYLKRNNYTVGFS